MSRKVKTVFDYSPFVEVLKKFGKYHFSCIPVIDENLSLVGVITKGDIVSQAEREVFTMKVQSVNPKAIIMHVNGLSGQGAYELSSFIYDETKQVKTLEGMKLRYPMPAALCSYCLGETRIGKSHQLGNIRKIDLSDIK